MWEGYIATKWLHDYVNGNFKVVGRLSRRRDQSYSAERGFRSIIITQDNVEQFEKKYEYQTTT